MYNEYLQKLENLKGKELKNTELKAEKIDLASLQDFDKLYKDATKQIQVAEGKGLSDLRKTVMRVDSEFLKLSRIISEALDMAKKIEKTAKDLGIDLGNELKGKVNVLKSADSNAEYWVKELNADQYR